MQVQTSAAKEECHTLSVVFLALVALIVASVRRGRRTPLFTRGPPPCQRVSVFLGTHKIDFVPVGKQYCEGGNHSWSVGRKGTEAHVVLVQKHAIISGDVILPLCTICMALFSNPQLERTHFTPHQLPVSVYLLASGSSFPRHQQRGWILGRERPPAAPTLTLHTLCGRYIFQQISQSRRVCSAVTGRANQLIGLLVPPSEAVYLKLHRDIKLC